MNKHYLYPNNLFVSASPTLVTTVLGSCISVCLYDPSTQIGGINHFMMPNWSGSGLASPKYGDIAMAKLTAKVILVGANKNYLIAKIFGGGMKNSGFFNIGERNLNVAIEYLRERNIPITAKHVKGSSARKIVFNTYTGEVGLKLV